MLMERLAGEMDPDRAVELIEAGVEPLNELIAALHTKRSSPSSSATAPRATGDSLPSMESGDAGTGRGAVVVTGASTGIGRATAIELDRLGFHVFAGVRKDSDAESIRGEGSDRLEPLTIDVADEASVGRRREVGRGEDRRRAASRGSSTTPASSSRGRSRAFRSTISAVSSRSTSSARSA